MSLLRAGSLCGIYHVSFSASTFVGLISVHRPLCLLFDLFYSKAGWFCHFSPPSSSSLCSPQCVSTLQLNTPHSDHQKREDAAFSGCRGFKVAQTHVFAAHVQPKVAGFALLEGAQCCRSITHPCTYVWRRARTAEHHLMWFIAPIFFKLYLPNLWCFGNVSSGTGKAN